MKFVYILFLFFIISRPIPAENIHPRILVNDTDKEAILKKIEEQAWAATILVNMKERIDTYVDRHRSEPEWILSRYLMNRIPGKRYTEFYCDSQGTALIGYDGDAPVATIRIPTHKRQPLSEDGYAFKLPSLEELTPYDTSRLMYLQTRSPEGKWEWADPQSFIGSLNGRINDMALQAAIVYWLTGEEKYGRFAADILDQWVKGAYFQNPVEGACRAGFLCIQALGDGKHENMILAYDFLYSFLKDKGYEIHYYESVFDKIATTMAFRGYYYNNWYAAQTTTLVYAALAMEDTRKRDEYLKYILEEDYIDGQCGRYCFASTVEKWLTEDGHWKEPGGYHTYPVTHLLRSSLALEKNGYEIFTIYPEFFDASYVMLKYSFPNFQASSFGDTGRPRQSPECLEIGIAMAHKYERKELSSLLAAMDVLIKEGGYKREQSGFMGLLCFVPEIPAGDITYEWPRSGKLDFARFYLQRNGTDPKYGLMYVVQGATYNHNHANGMAMELYGMGQVMGPDPGNGHHYEDPMHVRYYARWAAHNTVVADATSSSVPVVKGGGGTKNIGAIELYAMEPLADQVAVSPYCSFTDTRYKEASTQTNQQRTMAIIRTSPTSGYYVDIYRSDNPHSNQYLYHNIGDTLDLFDRSKKLLPVSPVAFPIQGEDIPGFSKISGYRSTGIYKENINARFSLTANDEPTYMQVWLAGNEERELMTALAPVSKTADPPYNIRPTPLLLAYQHGEAWKRPFVAVYEPFGQDDGYTIKDIKVVNNEDQPHFTELHINHTDASRQIVYQSVDLSGEYESGPGKCRGAFGVVSLKEGKVEYLYLGAGKKLSYEGIEVISTLPDGSVHLEFTPIGYTISCNQETAIYLPAYFSSVLFSSNGKSIEIIPERTTDGSLLYIPPCINATIQIILN